MAKHRKQLTEWARYERAEEILTVALFVFLIIAASVGVGILLANGFIR